MAAGKQLGKKKGFGNFVYLQFCSELSVAEHFGNKVLRAKEKGVSVPELFDIHSQHLIGWLMYGHPGGRSMGVAPGPEDRPELRNSQPALLRASLRPGLRAGT